jgi:hypothetical protein
MDIRRIEDLLKEAKEEARKIASDMQRTPEWSAGEILQAQVRHVRERILNLYIKVKDEALLAILDDILTNHDDSMNGLKEDLRQKGNDLRDAKVGLQKATERHNRAIERINSRQNELENFVRSGQNQSTKE